MKEIIEFLTLNHQTVAVMESCTGGGVANAITNIEGSSTVFKFGAVTYANEFKIKMGVAHTIIDTYTVYSMETAQEMSQKISLFASSDYGIGVTGKLNRVDPNNITGSDNTIYISIYDKNKERFFKRKVTVNSNIREENKTKVISSIIDLFLSILNN